MNKSDSECRLIYYEDNIPILSLILCTRVVCVKLYFLRPPTTIIFRVEVNHPDSNLIFGTVSLYKRYKRSIM